jgi:hypothetical protein
MPTRHRLATSLRLDALQVDHSALHTYFPQFSIQNPGSVLTPQPIDPPLPVPLRPVESPVVPHYACHDHYDLQAIEDARHSLGSPC